GRSASSHCSLANRREAHAAVVALYYVCCGYCRSSSRRPECSASDGERAEAPSGPRRAAWCDEDTATPRDEEESPTVSLTDCHGAPQAVQKSGSAALPNISRSWRQLPDRHR